MKQIKGSCVAFVDTLLQVCCITAGYIYKSERAWNKRAPANELLQARRRPCDVQPRQMMFDWLQRRTNSVMVLQLACSRCVRSGFSDVCLQQRRRLAEETIDDDLTTCRIPVLLRIARCAGDSEDRVVVFGGYSAVLFGANAGASTQASERSVIVEDEGSDIARRAGRAASTMLPRDRQGGFALQESAG